MEVDDAIVQLGAKLDAWLDGNLATISSMDRVAQFKALLAGIEITKELDLLKAKGLAAITALLNRQNTATEDERVASLIRAFEFAAKLEATLKDELQDIDGANKTVVLMDEIANALDATDPGRAVLAGLLDHPDDRVRASAGAYLLSVGLMPERVLPILHEIEDKGLGDCADFTAHWAILHWEREGKYGVKPK
jgi:SpoU rRNA methylase family enzyme